MEKRKNQELERNLVAMGKQLEVCSVNISIVSTSYQQHCGLFNASPVSHYQDSTARQEDYRREAGALRRDLRETEDRLHVAVLAASTSPASASIPPAPSPDGPMDKEYKDNKAGLIKLRPNVHFYPASNGASDAMPPPPRAENGYRDQSISQEEMEKLATASEGYRDDSDGFHSSIESPPTSPFPIAPSRDESNSPRAWKPPLSPKKKESSPAAVTAASKRADEEEGRYVLLEINIGGGCQSCIRIDVHSQPLVSPHILSIAAALSELYICHIYVSCRS